VQALQLGGAFSQTAASQRYFADGTVAGYLLHYSELLKRPVYWISMV
jgi:hypothetical protein